MDNRRPVFQKAGEPPETAARAVAEQTQRSASFDERMSAESARIRAREREATEVRAASGMGFWRLVWIVALGVLLAQAIAGGTVAVLGWLTTNAR